MTLGTVLTALAARDFETVRAALPSLTPAQKAVVRAQAAALDLRK